MGRTACRESQCLYKGDLYLYLYLHMSSTRYYRQITKKKMHFLGRFFKKSSNKKFHEKSAQVGAELVHADGRTDKCNESEVAFGNSADVSRMRFKPGTI